MDLEDLAKRFVDTEISYVSYQSFALSDDEALIAKALIVIYEAFHGGEEDFKDHITRVLDLAR